MAGTLPCTLLVFTYFWQSIYKTLFLCGCYETLLLVHLALPHVIKGSINRRLLYYSFLWNYYINLFASLQNILYD